MTGLAGSIGYIVLGLGSGFCTATRLASGSRGGKSLVGMTHGSSLVVWTRGSVRNCASSRILDWSCYRGRYGIDVRAVVGTVAAAGAAIVEVVVEVAVERKVLAGVRS
jgi:hypothetical protein